MMAAHNARQRSDPVHQIQLWSSQKTTDWTEDFARSDQVMFIMKRDWSKAAYKLVRRWSIMSGLVTSMSSLGCI